MDDEAGYFATEAGQFIANAHRYLSAAKSLTDPDNWHDNHKIPALHLLGHGVELFLKYPLLRAGSTQQQLVKAYGHDLTKLWADDANRLSREYVLSSAVDVWNYAKNSGEWPDDFEGDPKVRLVDALNSLAFLHGRESFPALRYTIPQPIPAPRPRFLIEAFGDIAERTCMNPAYLDD